MTPLRHSLCFLQSEALPLSVHPEEELIFLIQWLKQDYPLIVTRQPEIMDPKHIHLALPFFDVAQRKKIRSSFLFSKSTVTHYQELPELSKIFPAIKSPCEIRVFGSYCWQYLTQQYYIHEHSDLDLLFIYKGQSLTQLKALYYQITQELKSVQLDGEVRFPDLGECSWRELIQNESSPALLLKSYQNVTLIKREQLYAQFPSLLY